MRLLYVVPSYEPTQRLLEVVRGLTRDERTVVVIDDGSGGKYRHFFDAAEQMGAVVLRHGVNLGKGRALKTACNWFLNNTPDFGGILTLDSDGQHTLPDVEACAREFERQPDALILGARDFDAPQVPFKSRNGNKITRAVFRYLCGITLSDTQTGLRVLPRAFIPELTALKGERFEYETNMLLAARQRDIPMVEVKISTVYENNNAGTHFNPLRDSALIYALFGKYMASSLASAVVDIAIYALLIRLLAGIEPKHYILAATAGARIVSSLFNYYINKSLVFKKSGRGSMAGYYLLAVCQLVLSGYATTWLFQAARFLGEVGAKIIVDTVLFLCSFAAQRRFIFKRDKSAT